MSSAGVKAAKPLDSFAEAVESHWTSVYHLVYTLTGNRHDTEDLTQETFLRALRRYATYKAGTNLRAWLLRIATNAFLDAERRRKTLKFGPLVADVPMEGKSAEALLEITEQGNLIQLAAQELTELTRLVFHLRVTEDLAFKEIADMAGITEVAARQHMHQARVKLLKRLGE